MAEKETDPTNWKHSYEVMRKECIDILWRAKNEIMELRRINAALAPKADAYDCLRIALKLADPTPSQGYGEDLAYRFERRALELEEEKDNS